MALFSGVETYAAAAVDDSLYECTRTVDPDSKECIAILERLQPLCSVEVIDEIALERNLERYQYLLNRYQEQPHLLDPYVDQMLKILLDLIRSDDQQAASARAYVYACHLFKVRGHKSIMRRLPHEVVDLEPVVSRLEAERTSWQQRSVCLTWLNILCQMPFDLSLFDAASEHAMLYRILAVAKPSLKSTDRAMLDAAHLLGVVLSRPDARTEVLGKEVQQFLVDLRADAAATADKQRDLRTQRSVIGVLYTLAYVFKLTKRDDSLKLSQDVFSTLTMQCAHFFKSENTLMRKICTKLITRLGLTFLRPRVASWRYSRGLRMLGKASEQTEQKEQMEVEEDYQIVEEVEQVFDSLLQSLRDPEGVVRWCAAKGVGRLVMRIPLSMADEVTTWIIDLLSPAESDRAWHGACLCLAELARRGLLLPSRLPELMDRLQKALEYDEIRGQFSVGAHVRDAACYVCWAFARAYAPDILLPFVEELAPSLVIVSLFDREVNCRRAASAAFQENVGRQGTFPHGIDIITIADYFEVGKRTSCYEELSVAIARMGGYAKPLINHLLHDKTAHWDVEIRGLAAKALNRLTAVCPQIMSTQVLTVLIELVKSPDLFARHGSVIATGQVVLALNEFVASSGLDDSISDYVQPDLLETVLQIPVNLESSGFLQGHSADLMRRAVNEFLCCIARCHDLQSSKSWYDSIEKWVKILLGNVENAEEEIRKGAAQALTEVLTLAVVKLEASVAQGYGSKLTETLLSSLTKAQIETGRMGAVLALGSLPSCFLAILPAHDIDTILSTLIAHVRATNVTDKRWAESRRDCVAALSLLFDRLAVGAFDEEQLANISVEQAKAIFAAYLRGLHDYTVDSRGDIGVVVREGAMRALVDFMKRLVHTGVFADVLEPKNIVLAVSKLIQQSCEKIDRTRALAAALLTELLLHSPPVPDIPHRDQLMSVYVLTEEPGDTARNTTSVNWASGAFAFPRIAPLLYCSEYSDHVILGFIVSAGNITESITRHSSQAFLDYVKEVSENKVQLDSLMDTLVSLFRRYQKTPRVSLPLMRLLDQMFSSGYLELYEGEDECTFITDLVDCAIREVTNCRHVDRLNAALSLCANSLPFSTVTREKALTHLTVSLCHPYPRVRKFASEQLYEGLMTYEALDNHSESLMTLIDNTDWFFEPEQLVSARNDVAGWLGVEIDEEKIYYASTLNK